MSEFDWSFLPSILPGGEHWKTVRVVAAIGFVALALLGILLLYGGTVQKSYIGPISVRSKANMGRAHFEAPRTILTNPLEAKKIRCTFHFKYIDRSGNPHVIRLRIKKPIHFRMNALNKRMSYSRGDVFGFWNSKHAGLIHDTFVEKEISFEVADKNIIAEYPPADEVLMGLLDDTGEIVGVSQEIWSELADSHKLVVVELMKKYANVKKRKRFYLRPKEKHPDYVKIPDFAQPASIYMRMHFTANPLNHPDPQVKTTAWMTLLTSAFALFMQWLYNGF